MATRTDGTELISQILRRIIRDPSNLKYRTLNYKRINNKLSNFPALMELLYNAGFKKSDNDKYLTFDIKSLHSLELIYNEIAASSVIIR